MDAVAERVSWQRQTQFLTQFHLPMCTFHTSCFNSTPLRVSRSCTPIWPYVADLTSISGIIANIPAGACLNILYGVNRLNNRASLQNINAKNSEPLVFCHISVHIVNMCRLFSYGAVNINDIDVKSMYAVHNITPHHIANDSHVCIDLVSRATIKIYVQNMFISC